MMEPGFGHLPGNWDSAAGLTPANIRIYHHLTKKRAKKIRECRRFMQGFNFAVNFKSKQHNDKHLYQSISPQTAIRRRENFTVS